MSMPRYCIYVVFLINILCIKLMTSARCPSADLILPCRCLLKVEEYQIWCSHSDLPKVLSGLRALSQYIQSPIDELILENNYLPSLPSRTFSTLKVLRLMIRQNGLERVAHDWLFGLENILMELFIVEPKLRYLPDDAMGRLNALEALTMQTNDLKRLPQISSLAKLRYLQIESVELAELSSRNFKNLPLLKKIHISRSRNLKRLEAGLFEDLPLLKSINISFCGINWLHPRTFFSLPMIKELSLVGNSIQDAGMVGRSTKDLTSLQIIHLDFNNIDKLSEGSFVDIPSLQTLHLSFNNIVEIHHGAFHRIPSLRTLHLNNNKLRKIHPESFLQSSDSGLEELWMINNDISHISELKSLLDALPRLIFLDMSYNKLEIIPFGALRGHATLEVLKLNHNKLYQIDRESFMAMPALRELGLKNNSLTNFNQEPLWNLPSLKGLDISQNYYRRLEPRFLANLLSLRRLDISENELVTIDPICFTSTPSIEFINISRNDLQFIHPSTFNHLSNLYELDAGHNRLEQFLVDLPKGLEHLHLHSNNIKDLPFISGNRDIVSLRHLDLSYNLIEKIDPYNMKHFPHLRRLSIRRNFVHRLEEGAFGSLSKLEVLDLSKNKISYIHPNSFRNVNNLVELNLRNNNIESISPEVIQKMPKLSNLDVSRNRLVDFAQGSLSQNPHIKVLNISGNFLIEIPHNIFKMKRVKILDLSHNRIKLLPIGVFSKLEDLVELRMSDNYIEELKMGTFSNLKRLRILYLDHNDIDNIETNSFQSLPALEMIKLSRNKLSKIPSYSFNNLTMLQIAELEHNLLKTVSNNAFNLVPNLMILNLSHNHLLSVEDAGLRSVPSLEVLDLSDNVLGKIDSNSFRNMEWLVEIRMDRNNICGIFGAPFSNMPRLRVVSMKTNKITEVSEGVLDKIRTNIAVFDVDDNPLDCNCNALWLKAWAEESLTVGPHCSDGNLLREINFQPTDCKQKENKNSHAHCDSENNYPHYTSQVFSKYTSLGNMSNGERTNNLAPLPHESEYFYDEYVDYPFNESLTTDTNYMGDILDRFVRVNHSSLLTPQISSHTTPGDTPTLYAAPSTSKTKPDIPKEVPHSPSSSGFTFFGVPLPSLNFNKFLGGERKGASKKSESTLLRTPVADRKVAIMNMGTVARATTQNNVFRPPPPNLPHIETGGFVPMLPGDGGFLPIMNPITIKQDQSTLLEPHTEISVSTSKSIAMFKPSIDLKDSATSPNAQKSSQLNVSTTQTSVTFTLSSYSIVEPTNATPVLTTEEAAFESTTPESFLSYSTTTGSPFESVTDSLVGQTGNIKTILNETNNGSNTSTDYSRDLVRKDIDGKHDSNVTSIDTKSYPALVEPIAGPSTQNPEIITQNLKNGEFTLDKIANVNNGSKRIETASSLNTLLVPGGQQPHMRPSGRPLITKVQSPYTTGASASSGREQHVKQLKQAGETVTLDPEITKLDESKEKWYFANYNKTYSESFHGKISNTGSRVEALGYCVIFYILLRGV